MKNFFGYSLKGKDLLPIWLPFLVVFGGLYTWLLTQIYSLTLNPLVVREGSFYLVYGSTIVLVMLTALIFKYFFTARIITGVTYKDESVRFDGTFGRYMLISLSGLLLSIITACIYLPWYMRNIQRFFVDHSSLKSEKLSFRGSGSALFLILFVTLFVPFVVFFIVVILLSSIFIGHQSLLLLCDAIFIFILIPYMYLMYKWMVDIRYKNYFIRWESRFFPSVGKIALEIFFTLITAGIYSPLAYLKLYRYFAAKTVAFVDFAPKLRFGYDSYLMGDFWYIWGQVLLTLITGFIYSPWAFCKVATRILSKTYVEEITSGVA